MKYSWTILRNSWTILQNFELKNWRIQLNSWNNQLMILLNSLRNQSMILWFFWFEQIILCFYSFSKNLLTSRLKYSWVIWTKHVSTFSKISYFWAMSQTLQIWWIEMYAMSEWDFYRSMKIWIVRIFFFVFFNHSAKFVVFRVIVRIAVLKNFWFNARFVKAKFFSLIYLKNRIMFRKSWWFDKNSLIIAEKFELLFTNWRKRCVCRMMWSLRDECFEIELINREVFTRSKKGKLSKIEDEWRSEKRK
jgi:hypothetical protein